jgi:hypothetical protein
LNVDNAALVETILARRRVDVGVVCHNAGGWHSDRDLHTWPECAPLVTAIESFCGPLYYAWANINEPGDFNRSHVHKGPWDVSGVYFVDGRSGDLVFECRHGDVRFHPEPGLLVTFPALLRHRVELGSERRITVGFNVRR